jgi:hypothetical protein
MCLGCPRSGLDPAAKKPVGVAGQQPNGAGLFEGAAATELKSSKVVERVRGHREAPRSLRRRNL